MAAPVKITFLGGLGEIGRNCACIEVEGEIILLDCGLMFPDLDMLGIDLVLCDFTYLRENADRVVGCIATHGHEDHVGALSYLLRELSVPGLRVEAHARPGPQPHRGGGPARSHRADHRSKDGERRKIGPIDCEFLPVTHSVPHGFATAFHTPQGTILHSGDFKLDLTPVDGRLTDLSTMGAISRGEGIRLLLSDSTNADEPGHSKSETTVGSVLYGLFHAHEGRRIIIACFASHIHRVQQIADAAIAFDRKVATVGPVHEEERAAGPGDGRAAHPRQRHDRHRGRGRLRAGPGLCDLHRLTGRAHVGPVPDGGQGEPLARPHRPGHGHPQLPPDPGQRGTGVQGHRRPRPHRGQGRALGDLRRPRHRPRPAGRAEDLPLGHPARLVRARPRRVPPPDRPRRAWPRPWGSSPITSSSARTATRSSSTTTGCTAATRCPPATCTSTASSATSARGCCATGRCWPTRASSSSSSRSTPSRASC